MSTMRPRSHSTDFTMPSLSRTNELIVSNNSHEEQFILVDEPPSPTTPTPSTSAFVILGRGGQIESSEGEPLASADWCRARLNARPQRRLPLSIGAQALLQAGRTGEPSAPGVDGSRGPRLLPLTHAAPARRGDSCVVRGRRRGLVCGTRSYWSWYWGVIVTVRDCPC